LRASSSGPPKVASASAVSSTTTGLTSGERTTCPWRRASSRRFGVARSVRSAAPSAIREPPHEAAERRIEVAAALSWEQDWVRRHLEAAYERPDQELLHVEHEEDEQRQQLLPLGDDAHLRVRLRVDQVDDAEAHLDAGELPAELDAGEDELRHQAEHGADRRL